MVPYSPLDTLAIVQIIFSESDNTTNLWCVYVIYINPLPFCHSIFIIFFPLICMKNYKWIHKFKLKDAKLKTCFTLKQL